LKKNIYLEPSTFQRRGSDVSRRTLCGVIKTLDENSMLKPTDVVVISLCDITLSDWTRLDFPHIPQRLVLSHIKLNNCDYFPIPFTLYYNADEINENLCYGIRCDIFDKHDEVKYSSEQFINVLTDEYPKTNVHITVIPSNIPSTTNDKTDDDDD
jgi:uncharacterized lipoprotein YbaY